MIVCGFATVEGLRALTPSLSSNPAAVDAIVLGAATHQAFQALDRIESLGVSRGNLHVHLGHTRATSTTGRRVHRFYRYHPMLHSKIYYAEHSDDTVSVVVGSHNMTGYALCGLNGEAAILLEGRKDDLEAEKIRRHILASIAQSIPYDPTMKTAYSWWTHQSLSGISDKANDLPKEGESKKTIVILAEASGGFPKKDDIVYFELPLALGRINTMNAEVHIYLFDSLPQTPSEGLLSTSIARQSLWCWTLGLEMERGGRELTADWYIDNYTHPVLQRAPTPFRPTPAENMQQVRVKVRNEVRGSFEYLFKDTTERWLPLLDENDTLKPPDEHHSLLAEEYKKPNPEDKDWQRVVGLIPEEEQTSSYRDAIEKLSPEGGSYVMISFRRKVLSKRQRKKKE